LATLSGSWNMVGSLFVVAMSMIIWVWLVTIASDT
jgi:hypothetical protein